MKTHSLLMRCAVLAALSSPAIAHENDTTAPHAMDHAPIGVMADHRHKTGEWMLSYRYMTMDMDGSRDGTTSLTPDQIATSAPNRFFGTPGQPPTLRVVPTKMKMDMHMVGAMYGLSDKITLMGMTSFVTNDMDHLTYQGGMGDNIRGGFTTKVDGIGDSTLGAIIALDDGMKPKRQINLNLLATIPTGSNTATDDVLTPMGGTPTLRLPYPMQIGTGTFDLKPALTYFDRMNKIGWGAQVSSRIAMTDNKEGYKRGTRLSGTAWLAYEPAYWVSFSGRLNAVSQGKISGIDPNIIAPVQTADPDNFGGEQVQALFGINLAGQSGSLKGHRLALEFGLPIYQNLNGPQLETDSTLTVGWQKAF